MVGAGQGRGSPAALLLIADGQDHAGAAGGQRPGGGQAEAAGGAGDDKRTAARRTFFRYYSSKEDVVIRFLADQGALIAGELAARPRTEAPSVALREAVWVPLAAACTDQGDQSDHTERSRVVVRLILDTPALQARWLERQIEWRGALAAELADRRGVHADLHPYPRMAAAMALLALDTVLQQWRPGDDERRLADLTDAAFAVVAPALDAPVGAPGAG
jgi:AcrR family transcriptional regulator